MKQFSSIRMFVRVVETGSFTKAAELLNVRQPSVTRHVAGIERELGTALLRRTTRGVSVTEFGSAFYTRCKTIIRELDEIENDLVTKSNSVSGILRVIAPYSFCNRILSGLAVQFLKNNPSVRIDLDYGNPYSNLISDGVDLAIRMGNSRELSFGQRRVGSSPWVFVASPDYLQRHGEPHGEADLYSHDGLVYSLLKTQRTISSSTYDAFPPPLAMREVFRSNDLQAIIEATAGGLGIALVPAYVAMPCIRSGEIVEVLKRDQPYNQGIYAVLPSSSTSSPKVRCFIDFLSDRLKGDWWLQRTPASQICRLDRSSTDNRQEHLQC